MCSFNCKLLSSTFLWCCLLCCTRWQDRVPNTEVLDRAGLLSMPALLSHRRVRWLGHVHRMDPHRLPREILYGELRDGARRVGRPQLQFKDVCKRDMKGVQINADTWVASHADILSARHALLPRGVRDKPKERLRGRLTLGRPSTKTGTPGTTK